MSTQQSSNTAQIKVYSQCGDHFHPILGLSKRQHGALVQAVKLQFNAAIANHQEEEPYGKSIPITFEGKNITVYLKRTQDLEPGKVIDQCQLNVTILAADPRSIQAIMGLFKS